jgi:hypothetical protein
MLKFDAKAFFDATTALSRSGQVVEAWQKTSKDKAGPLSPLSDSNRSGLANAVAGLLTSLAELGAQLTLLSAQRLHQEMTKDECKLTYAELKEWLLNIESRLRDELSLTYVFVLDSRRSSYFKLATSSFGRDVTDRLPNAIPDIEDAGKCLALGQGTASVFHLMRVMEAALKSLAGLLGIPYAPSWESYIGQIERCITEKHKRKTVQWKRDEAFYREILGNLQTIKIVWRNPTMHIVRRYSVEEAEEIYIAVRGFLQRIAPRLPKPKAPRIRGSLKELPS